MRVVYVQLILAACIASAIAQSIKDLLFESVPNVNIRRKNALLPCTCSEGVLDCSERNKFSLTNEDRCSGTVSTVNLFGNEFAVFPDGFQQATVVNVSENQLRSLPLSTQLNPRIKLLDLSENEIINPTENGFRSLGALETLLVYNNFELGSLQFLPLPCGLRHLDAHHINLESIQGPLTQCTQLQTLDLNGNSLTTLPENAFSALTQLRDLNLGRNSIASIPSTVFNALTQLRSLDLHFNGLRSLPRDIFNSLSNLEKLNLRGNLFNSLPSGIFSSLPRLRHLNLVKIPFDSIPTEVANLPALEELQLAFSGYTRVPENAFSSSTRLKEIILMFNNISSLPNNVFSGLSNLEAVALGNNPMTTLPSNIFSDSPNLNFVGLPCIELNAENLRIVRNVTSIVYAYCGRTDLKAGGLSVLSRVEFFIITRSGKMTVEDGAFIGLSHLRLLDLSENGITDLPVGVFSPLSQLQTLVLISNMLTTIPERLFSGLNTVKTIILSHNRFTQVPENLFQGLQSLETVDLSMNLLTTVPSNLFAGLPSLQSVNFENTMLTSLPAFNPAWASIRKLSFSYNSNNLTLDAASMRPWLGQGERYLQLESARGEGWPPAQVGWLLREPGVTVSAGSPRGCHCGMVRKGDVLLHLCIAIRCDRRARNPDDWLAAALRDAGSAPTASVSA